MKAIILARVSTEEQDSNDAQMSRLIEFAKGKGFNDFVKYAIEESSTRGYRKKFQKIIEEIETSKEPIALFVDTIDRLQRGFDETVIFSGFIKRGKVELYFYKENLYLHKNSRTMEILMWDFGVINSKSYVLNLGDNVKRKFEFKRKNGEITGPPPFGYKSDYINKEKRLRSNVIPDPERIHILVEIFERYSKGDTSARKLAENLAHRDITTQYGRPVSQSHIHNILKNKFYYGEAYSPKYDLLYEHNYETFISKDLWERVREIRENRNRNPKKTIKKKEFTLGGLFDPCPKCGCSFTAEIKKGKHVYYSCTDAKGSCKREYVNEKILLTPIKEVLKNIRLSDEQLEQIVEYLKRQNTHQAKYHREEVKRLRGQYDAEQRRLDKLLDFFMDGKVKEEDYERKVRAIKDKQRRIEVELESYTNADESYHITAKTVLSLAQRAEEIFESSEVVEKRELLKFVFQNLSIKEKRLNYSLRSPFDVLVGINNDSLLRGLDSNQ